MSKRPLVYSCSGYSSAGQLANTLALELDRQSVAEMSCIAGVGGGVPALVQLARSGRPIIALDGCPMGCVAASLACRGVEPALHVTLSDLGVLKKRHGHVPLDLVDEVRRRLLDQISQAALVHGVAAEGGETRT